MAQPPNGAHVHISGQKRGNLASLTSIPRYLSAESRHNVARIRRLSPDEFSPLRGKFVPTLGKNIRALDAISLPLNLARKASSHQAR
jgi:hypothetical protein